jgi:hypothetical protein
MNNELIHFFEKYDEKYFLKSVSGLLDCLSRKISFEIKIQQASIQLMKEEKTFVVFGFRRSKNYYFVEFFSKIDIQDDRIIQKINKDELVINRVEIKTENDIDSKLIDWILNSYRLMIPIVPA